MATDRDRADPGIWGAGKKAARNRNRQHIAWSVRHRPSDSILHTEPSTANHQGCDQHQQPRWQGRELYKLLGMRRARLWQVYSPGTLARYAVAAARGQHLSRPVEDVRQMGGDALICDGTVVRRWLPRTPDDRVLPARLLHAAKLAALQGPPTPREPAGNDDQPR